MSAGVILISRLPIPLIGSCIINRSAITHIIAKAKTVLSFRVILLCGSAEPLDSRLVILLNALAVIILIPKGIAFFRRFMIRRRCIGNTKGRIRLLFGLNRKVDQAPYNNKKNDNTSYRASQKGFFPGNGNFGSGYRGCLGQSAI